MSHLQFGGQSSCLLIYDVTHKELSCQKLPMSFQWGLGTIPLRKHSSKDYPTPARPTLLLLLFTYQASVNQCLKERFNIMGQKDIAKTMHLTQQNEGQKRKSSQYARNIRARGYHDSMQR